jgi:glycosyltransferase involved in cell wall biosynthesis
MLTDQSLLYFAPEPWDGLWRNRQQLMSIFARRNKVLFVEEYPYLRRALDHWRRGRAAAMGRRRAVLRRLTDNLAVLRYPSWAPVSNAFPLARLTQAVRRFYLATAMHTLGMSQPILWLSRPGMVKLLPEMPSARLRIYHVVDEYAAYVSHTENQRQQVALLERAMLQQVDLVITVSEKLQQAKSAQHPHTYLVPNAVDYALYEWALSTPDLPPALAAIPTPRLGYIGLIGDKLDFDLLFALASAQPACSLLFLGDDKVRQQRATWQRLLQLPNVHYLPTVPANQVPEYAKGFTVGLMPYVCNQHAEHISPLKLYDYLAAGLPVVSVNIPAARTFGAQVYLANTPDEFISAVTQAVVDQSPAACQRRRALAAQHTWEGRVEQISALIESALATTQMHHAAGQEQWTI